MFLTLPTFERTHNSVVKPMAIGSTRLVLFVSQGESRYVTHICQLAALLTPCLSVSSAMLVLIL